MAPHPSPEIAPQSQQLRRHSLTLLRSASTTFTGGASVAPLAAEGTSGNNIAETTQDQAPAYQPVRQPSQRQVASQTQDDVQQRLVEEVTAFVTDNFKWIILCVFCFAALLITMFVLFVLALVAAIYNREKACDQPLQWYLFAVLSWGQVPGPLTDCVARRCGFNDGDRRKVFLAVAFSLPGWGLLAWGVYMIKVAKTCPKTNPGLFYPTEHYIIAQVFMAFFMFCIGIFAGLGFRRFLLWMNSLIVKPGCVEAVRKLPKVDTSASELIDEEDGEVKACIICLDSLGGERGQQQGSEQNSSATTSLAIVRTPCNHLFHEDCLVGWCKNHIDCPLCREPVGEPDPKDGQTDPGEP